MGRAVNECAAMGEMMTEFFSGWISDPPMDSFVSKNVRSNMDDVRYLNDMQS